MNIAASLARGRAAALARMTSRVTVHRRTGFATQDESSGREVPEWVESYSDLPFRLGGSSNGASSSSRLSVAEDVPVAYGVRTGHLPAGTVLRDDDLIEVVVGENAGTVWRVVDSGWKDQSTALRPQVIATERPGEWS